MELLKLKTNPKSPTPTSDVSGFSMATLFMLGGVIARILPIYLSHPVTDQASLEKLTEALEALSDELEQDSPLFSTGIMDGIVSQLQDFPEKIYPDLF